MNYDDYFDSLVFNTGGELVSIERTNLDPAFVAEMMSDREREQYLAIAVSLLLFGGFR